jgi:hypothetical protein
MLKQKAGYSPRIKLLPVGVPAVLVDAQQRFISFVS